MMIIGHNRKATHGSKTDNNSHPFWSDDNKIVLVHNGMVSNQKDFCKEATVDSEAICNAPEFFMDQLGKARHFSEFHSISSELENLNGHLEQFLENR